MKNCDFLLMAGSDFGVASALQTKITGPVQRALFVALLLRAGHWLSRDYVADLLWSECDQATARQRLRANLFNLRRSLGSELQGLLEIRDDTLSFLAPRQSIDVFLFQELASSGDPGSRLEAIDLYQNGLLSDFPSISEEFDRMLSQRREELRILFISLCTDVLTEQSLAGENHSFEATLRKALRADRANFDIVSIAMRHAAKNGQAEKVGVIFSGYERTLRENFDVEPEPHMFDLRDEMTDTAKERISLEPKKSLPSVAVEPGGEHVVAIPAKTDRRLRLRYWLPISLVFAVIVAAWLGFLRSDIDDAASGPVFFISSTGPRVSACELDGLENQLGQSIQAALKEIAGSSIVIGDPGPVMSPPTNAFWLDWKASCSDSSVRLTLTFTRAKTRELVLVRRVDTSFTTMGSLSDLLFTSVAPFFEE